MKIVLIIFFFFFLNDSIELDQTLEITHSLKSLFHNVVSGLLFCCYFLTRGMGHTGMQKKKKYICTVIASTLQ